MVQIGHSLSIRQQCQLLNINRSRLYYQPTDKEADIALTERIKELYVSYPIYGYRRITVCLRNAGEEVNSKKVRRLMKSLGLIAIYPAPKTTIVDRQISKYPYLLKGLQIDKPHQVWQVDITYLRTDCGFMYLTALIDMYSRFVVGCSLSNSLDAYSCTRAFEHARITYQIPEIINSDQGSQFTSEEWLQGLRVLGIRISMSGGGRSNDNAYIERLWRTLKYEWIFIKDHRTSAGLKIVLADFIRWYNFERPHQSLGYMTPYEMLINKQKSLLF
jgi:putative transposase